VAVAAACALAVLGTLVPAPPAGATSPAANGLLAYADRDGPVPTIRVVSPDGTNIRSLFPPGNADDDPAWSANGRKLAFTRTIAGKSDIWVDDVARNGRPKQVTSDPADAKEPAWSPDNRHLVFSSTRDGNAELYILDTETLAVERLTFDPAADGQPTWSQTNRIAFVSDRTGNLDIFVTKPVPGAPVTQLTSNPGPDMDPSWSPSGSQLAFASGPREDAMSIFTIAADGSRRRRLTGDPGSERFPSWAPDGTAIAYTRRALSSQLTLAALNAGVAGRPLGIVGGAEHPSWAPLAPAASHAQATPASTVTVTPADGSVKAIPGEDSGIAKEIASQLSGPTQLPVGPTDTSTVLATASVAVISGAATTPSAPPPVALVDSSRAEITQSTPSAPLTVRLTSLPKGCSQTPATTASAHHRRRHHPPNVRMQGDGLVLGQHSIAGSGGTQWITAETCVGTVTVVRRGTVIVTDTGQTPVPVRASECHVASPRLLTPAQRQRACAIVRSLPR
jgi:tol-pal system beta propeller repeat protein TolB